MASENETLSHCLAALRKAKNDTEKIAALFLVTKVVHAKDTTSETRQTILDAIGLSFLFRLFTTNDSPDSISDYQMLAAAILSALCQDSEVITNKELLSRLHLFNPILNAKDRRDSAICDCLQILENVATSFDGCQAIIGEGCIEPVCASLYTPDSERAEAVLVSIINMCGEETWTNSNPEQLMNFWTQNWKSDRSERKFIHCRVLSAVISSLPQPVFKDQPWPEVMLEELCEILSCKLGSQQRNPSLSLAAALLDRLGVHHMIDDYNNGRKFFYLLCHLCSIEIVMIFDNPDELTCSGILISCYGVMETLLYYLITSDVCSLSSEEISHLQRALQQAVSAVLVFLKQVYERSQQIFDDLLYATLRLVGAWLAEETSEMRTLVIELLPFFLLIGRKTLTKLNYNLSHQSPNPDSAICLPNMNVPDVMRFLIPGLCHLSAEDQPRLVLLQHELLPLLRDYTFYHWKIFKEQNSEDSSLAMRTVFGILLNLAILEPQRVAQDAVFLEIFRFIAESVTVINPAHNLLKANFITVGLMLLRHLPTEPHHQTREFLSEAMTFLLAAHHLTPSGVQLSDTYEGVWEDLQELWLLGMQVLVALIPAQPVLKLICTRSYQGLIMDLLKSDFDPPVSDAYESLLKGIKELRLNSS